MSFQQIEVGHILYLNLDLLNWGIRKHRDATRRGDGCSARWLQRQLHRKRPGTAELASASHPHQEAAHGAPATRGRTGVGGSGPDHQKGLQPGVQARAPAILPPRLAASAALSEQPPTVKQIREAHPASTGPDKPVPTCVACGISDALAKCTGCARLLCRCSGEDPASRECKICPPIKTAAASPAGSLQPAEEGEQE